MDFMPGVDTSSRGSGASRRHLRLDALGLLQVGGVLAGAAVDDLVLAGVGDGHELVGVLAADGPAVGLHHHGRQAAAVVDSLVGPLHFLVADVQGLPVGVEAVEVHHVEFPDAEQAAARPRLVAELGLYLVEQLGQVAVASHLVAGQLGDDLLVRGAEDQSCRSRRSTIENRFWPKALCRPDFSHSSSGCSAGIISSWPPIRSISSRTICSSLRSDRQPRGR